VSSEELSIRLKEGESEHLAFRLFFGHETIETLVAFANAQGGAILLGISELKEIKGVPDAKESIKQWTHEIHTRTAPCLSPFIELIEIDKKIVVQISVAEYPIKPVSFDGKYFKRLNKFNQELTVKEAIVFRWQTMNSNWDSNTKPGKTVADISFRKLYRQIRRISRKKRSLPEEPFTFLRKYSLLEGDTITNACWLLFGMDEMPETTIELGCYSSPTVTTDTLTLKCDLFTEAEEAMRFICKYISKETQPNASLQWLYPLEAIRELVINMIIHRDYTADYNSIIKIFNGYIEFYNPGALPDDLSIKHLLSEGYISRPRNRQIVELFKDAGMFDDYGTGIRQIRAAFTNKGLRLPEFIKLPGRLIVRVFGETTIDWKREKKDTEKTIEITDNYIIQEEANPESKPEQKQILTEKKSEVNQEEDSFEESDSQNENYAESDEHINDRERLIITCILEDNRIPLNDIAQKLNVSKRTILRDIKKMKRGKILERIGSEKNGYWEINSSLLS